MRKTNYIFKYSVCILSFLLVVFSFFKPVLVFSQDAQTESINISPPIFSNLTANPGDVLSNSIRITNNTTNQVNLTMLVKDYTAVGEEGAVSLQDPTGNSPYSLASWIRVSPDNFSIPANAYKFVKFTIVVPNDAEPGGRYASIVAYLGPNSTGSSGSGIGTQLGSLILLTVAGDAKVSASLLSFTSTPFVQGGNVSFSQRIDNTGNVHIRPTGQIVVNDVFGRKVANVNMQQADVLPGAIRKTTESLNVDNWIGYYNAVLTSSYNSEGKNGVFNATSSFAVVPLLKIAIVLAVIIVIYLLRSNIFRAFRAFVKG